MSIENIKSKKKTSRFKIKQRMNPGKQFFSSFLGDTVDEVEDESALLLEYTPEMKNILLNNNEILLEEIFAGEIGDWDRHLVGFRVE